MLASTYFDLPLRKNVAKKIKHQHGFAKETNMSQLLKKKKRERALATATKKKALSYSSITCVTALSNKDKMKQHMLDNK